MLGVTRRVARRLTARREPKSRAPPRHASPLGVTRTPPSWGALRLRRLGVLGLTGAAVEVVEGVAVF